MIVVTGAAGFIGSMLVRRLLDLGEEQIVIVDDFAIPKKRRNLKGREKLRRIHRDKFPGWLRRNAGHVRGIYHLGARTDTTLFDRAIFDRLNLNYTKALWATAAEVDIPFIYASSAATYGNGDAGFSDKDSALERLKPLNPYGESKHHFDLWAQEQAQSPTFWAGLKFFNVYGPNEWHKGRMASVVFHAYHQIRTRHTLQLFQSHREDYAHGMQLRDFVYVKDVIRVMTDMMQRRPASGLYNLGTGKARSFLDLGKAVFHSMSKPEQIEFIPMPEDLRATYQYFTEASMDKLGQAGINVPATSLEEGIEDYVQNYLLPEATA